MAKPKVKALSAKGALQEKRFVDEYLVDLNAARAARVIGHSEKSAEKFGCLMLQRPSVAKAVQEAMDARSEKTGITAKRVIDDILEIIAECKQAGAGSWQMTTRLKAEELLGRHIKMWTDRVDVRGDPEAPLKVIIEHIGG